jgi:hypothetical protein
MNKSYRSIYNERLGAWVAVSETASARGKKSSGAVKLGAMAIAIAAFAGAGAANAITVGSNDLGSGFEVQPGGSTNSTNAIAIGQGGSVRIFVCEAVFMLAEV